MPNNYHEMPTNYHEMVINYDTLTNDHKTAKGVVSHLEEKRHV